MFTYTGPSSTDIRGEISVNDTGGLGSLSYDNSTGVITYTGPSSTDIRGELSGGTGVTYSDLTGVIAIGQDVATTANVTFSSVVFDGISAIDTATTPMTVSAVTAAITSRTSMKAQINLLDTVTGEIHSVEAFAMKKGTNAYLTTYAELYSNAALATFTADVSGGNLRIRATPTGTNAVTVTSVKTTLD